MASISLVIIFLSLSELSENIVTRSTMLKVKLTLSWYKAQDLIYRQNQKWTVNAHNYRTLKSHQSVRQQWTIHYCELQLTVSTSAVRRRKSNSHSGRQINLRLIHHTWKHCYFRPVFWGPAISIWTFPSVPTNNGKLGLFTSQDRGFLIGGTLQSKIRTVLGKKGHLVTQVTH